MTKVALVDPALARLAPRFAERLPPEVEVAAVRDFGAEELARVAAGATVFVNARCPIDASTLALAPGLRLIQAIGVGIDSIDRDAVAAAGVALAYNPGVNRTGAAEHTLMLMLALIKRLPASERATRTGRFAPGEINAEGI